MLNAIKVFFILFLSLLLLLIFSLFYGITISSFSFANISISKLYIKLDKKFIVNIDKIIILNKSDTNNNSIYKIKNDLDKLPFILNIFKKITINMLKIGDNEFHIYIDKKHLYLDNKYINISSKISFVNEKIILDLYSVYIKNIKLLIQGKIQVNKKQDKISLLGQYTYDNIIKGDLNLLANERFIDFFITSKNEIKSIKFLKKYFTLDPIAEEWMYDNVQGKLKLDYLFGKIDLINQKLLLDTLEGKANIRNAKVSFHKKLKYVYTKNLEITYKKEKLSLDLHKPTYNKTKIYGSKVYITNLTSGSKGVVFVDLKSKSILNKDIITILKAYNIKLGLRQFTGKLDSSLLLKIPYASSKEIDIKGLFKVKNAKLKLNDFEFIAHNAIVELKNKDVFIKNADVSHKEMFNALVNLDIDTSTSLIKGNAFIKSFFIKTNDVEVLNIKNVKTKLDINFKNNLKINLKDLNTQININKNTSVVNIKNLSIFSKYSKLLNSIDVKKGNINLNIAKNNDIHFTARLKNLNYPIYKNKKQLTTLEINGKINKNEIFIKSKDELLSIRIDKSNKINAIFKNIEIHIKNNSKIIKSKTNKKLNIDLKFLNSTLKIKNSKYDFKVANIKVKDNNVFFSADLIHLDIPISKNSKKITSMYINGSYINDILKLNALNNEFKLEIMKDKTNIYLKNHDIHYDTKEALSDKMFYHIQAFNSTIIINDKYKVFSDTFSLDLDKNYTNLNLKSNKTKLVFTKNKQKEIKINIENMSDKFINALLNKSYIKNGSISLNASGNDNIIQGQIYLKQNEIKDLALLNNLLILINTSPALINPFLAIPSLIRMATNDGFKLNGYKVIKGRIDFKYNLKSKVLNMVDIHTQGNGIDFTGSASIDFEKSYINSDLNLVFMKNYSKIVGIIPVVNYIILGDNKKIETKVKIIGTLDNPKYVTQVIKDGVSAPLNIIKRIITSPLKLIDLIKTK